MILATSLPTENDREAALALVSFHPRLRALAGLIAGALRNKSIDLIDIAIGTPHARGAIVALQEAADATVQATLELAEAVICERIFARTDIIDPLGTGALLRADEGLARMRTRVIRMPLEDAAVRLAAAGNHLVNAHVRLAWEANAATRAEVLTCGFDPEKRRRFEWMTLEQFEKGLNELNAGTLGSVFPSFALNDVFRRYAGTPAVIASRDLRDAVVHRDRPTYREAAAFGRASVWAGREFEVTVPGTSPDEDPHAPTIAERREVLAEAAGATLAYIEETWDLTIRWLRTVRVFVIPGEGQVQVTSEFTPGARTPVFPREQRDPGPFLRI
jgi:hypothetical protein